MHGVFGFSTTDCQIRSICLRLPVHCCFSTTTDSSKPRFHSEIRSVDVQGSGYLTACFSYATQPGSYVLGVEKFTDVAENSILNLNRHNKNLIASGAIEIQAGNIYDIVGTIIHRD